MLTGSSLAAFPVGFDSGYGPGTTSNQDWAQGEALNEGVAQNSMQEWSELSLQGVTGNVGSEWDDNTSMDITGNGLYWFWDTMWTEPRSQL
jgi:hypothetical protein